MANAQYTIVPFFSIDEDHLRSLLDETSSAITLANHAASRPRMFSRRPSSFCIGISDANSAIKMDPVAAPRKPPDLWSSRFRFLAECEVQVHRLFNFLEQHLSKAERDLAVLVDVQPSGDAAAHYSIQLVESGSHRDRDSARSHASHLRHLRDVLLSLQVTLQTSFAAMNDLARRYDLLSATPDGRAFVEAKMRKRAQVEARLEACSRKVDAWLQVFYDRYEQGHHQSPSEPPPTMGPSQIQVSSTDTNSFKRVKSEKVHPLTGLYVMLFLVLSTVTVFLYSWGDARTWVVFFRMVRSPILITLYIFLLAVNMKIWTRNKINYVSIFGFPQKGVATPNYLIAVAGFFTMLFSMAIAVFLLVSPFTFILPGKLIPLVMWACLLAFLLNPFGRCLHVGRKSFLYTLLRLLVGLFTESTFADVWLGIQLGSVAIILLDLEYTLCYVVQGPWSGQVDPLVCTGSENAVRPCLASLPAFLQLLQNLKLFADRRQRKFLVNALKHLTVFPIIIFATLFSINLPDTPHFEMDQIIGNKGLEQLGGCWLFFAIVNSLYSFAWDVYYDWGLWRFSKRTVLRPILLYQWRSLYHIATFIDLIFQSFWSLEITLALVWRYNPYTDLIYTGLVVAEILRLFMWNFFKLEYQQVKRLTA